MRARGRLWKTDFEFDTKHPSTIQTSFITTYDAEMSFFWTIITKALKVRVMGCNRKSGYWASETPCGASKFAAFHEKSTMPLSNFQIWLTYQEKGLRKLISVLLMLESTISDP